VDGVAVEFLDGRLDAAVVEQDAVARLDAADRQRQPDHLVRHLAARHVGDRRAVLQVDGPVLRGRPDLRTGEVVHHPDGLVHRVADLADAVDELLAVLGGAVAGVHPDDVHASRDQFPEVLFRVRRRADGTDDFGVSHGGNLLGSRAERTPVGRRPVAGKRGCRRGDALLQSVVAVTG